MGWAGGKAKVSVPDTSKQEAELRRQTELLMRQFDEMMRVQQEQFTSARDADAQRYSEQRASDLAEGERQRSILQTLLNDQRSSQEEINARLEEERAYAAEQTALRASRGRAYADGRENIIDQVVAAMDAAYGGFDDDFYGGYAEDVVRAARPGADRDYRDTRRDSRLALADTGNLNSSAAARALAKVQTQYKTRLGQIAGEASDTATRLRDQIEGQKRSALSGLINSAFVGDPNLSEFETDVGGALDQITSRLNTYLSDVTAQVNTYVPMGGSGTVQPPQIVTPQINLPSQGSNLVGGSSLVSGAFR